MIMHFFFSLDLSYVTDPRIKGFSPEGILHSDRSKFFYSLTNNLNFIGFSTIASVTKEVCTILYLLATKTTFFGKIFRGSLDIIILNDDILFIGALLMRTICMIFRNAVRVGC